MPSRKRRENHADQAATRVGAARERGDAGERLLEPAGALEGGRARHGRRRRRGAAPRGAAGGAHGGAPRQKQFWYPWHYIEGLTLAEATNEMAFLVTGLYGKPVPKQNGAPIRLATPWKYGFKSTKSIVRFTFTDQRPVSFWEHLQKT